MKSSQLEVLKLEWGKKMLRLHSVMTKGHAELLESAYKDKVLSWVRKMVAKQQMRDLARMQAESVSLTFILCLQTIPSIHTIITRANINTIR